MEHKRRNSIQGQPAVNMSPDQVTGATPMQAPRPVYIPPDQVTGATPMQVSPTSYMPQFSPDQVTGATQQITHGRPAPAAHTEKKPRRKWHFRIRPGFLFRSFLMFSGAAAWIFLILKYAIVPLLSLISGIG